MKLDTLADLAAYWVLAALGVALAWAVLKRRKPLRCSVCGRNDCVLAKWKAWRNS